MDPTVPTTIAALVPLIGTSLSALFITDKLSPKQNALIALAAILVVSISCEALTLTSGLPGSKAEIFLATLGYVGVFMKGDLGMLYQSLLNVNSNNLSGSRITPLGTSAFVPTGSTTPTVIPPRASAQPPDA